MSTRNNYFPIRYITVVRFNLNSNLERRWPAASIFIRHYSICYQVNGPKRAAAHGVLSFLGDRFNEPCSTSHPVSQRLIGVVTFSDLIYARETLSPDVDFLLPRSFSIAISRSFPSSFAQVIVHSSSLSMFRWCRRFNIGENNSFRRSLNGSCWPNRPSTDKDEVRSCDFDDFKYISGRMVNQCSIVLQSYNWTPVSSDIAIEGSIAIQGYFSRVPSLAYFYGVEIFSNAPCSYTYEEPKLRTEKLTNSIEKT